MRSGFWRKCRVCFRWCRISVWLLVLAVVCAFVWFNRIGLPDFLKTRLVATLHERGVELEFSRMRLRFERGIVRKTSASAAPQTLASPVLTLAEVQLQLDFRALLHRQLQVDGLVLRQGKFLWPVSPTNTLRLDDIQTDTAFPDQRHLVARQFPGGFRGRQTRVVRRHRPRAGNPQLGDFSRRQSGQLPGRAGATAKIFRRRSTRSILTGAPQLKLTAGRRRAGHPFVCRPAEWSTPPARKRRGFRRATSSSSANLTAPADAPTNFDSSWSFWTNLQPYRLEWTARGAQLKSEKLNADSVACGGFWRAPELALTNLSARLGGGRLDGRLEIKRRHARIGVHQRLGFRPARGLERIADGKDRERLADIFWTQPPTLQVAGSLVLPAWTNAQPDWNGEVRPTMRLLGELAFTNGTVMGANIDSAHTHFSYLDLVWQLPALAVAQAKTRLEISGIEDDATKNYRWHIRGVFDPAAARPFLTASNAVRGFELVKLSEPLALDVDVSGRLYDYDSIAANGRVALTNFTVRGEHYGDVIAAVNYTNRVLAFLHPLMHTGAQTATADSVTLDFNQRLIFSRTV